MMGYYRTLSLFPASTRRRLTSGRNPFRIALRLDELEPRRVLSIVPFSPQPIAPTADQAKSVFAADLDNDGDLDVLSASSGDNKIAWYENTDGLGTFGWQRLISSSANQAVAVSAADLDGDQDLDVLSVSFGDRELAWYENTDGTGNFGPARIISDKIAGAYSVQTVDFDGDGDQDVLSGNAWFENVDGRGAFTAHDLPIQLSTTRNAVYAADMDSDGDHDIVALVDREIIWLENADGAGSFRVRETITVRYNRDHPLFATDMDGDDDIDVIVAAPSDNLIWYENPDGPAVFGAEKVITSSGRSSIFPTDLDGDGDPDLLASSEGRYPDRIEWYENVDGLGTFAEEKVIASDTDAASIISADLDSDGDLDILWAAYRHSLVSWTENTDGNGTFGPQRPISIPPDVYFWDTMEAADVDSDGDADLLVYEPEGARIAWYENVDGLGNFPMPPHTVTTEVSSLNSIVPVDLDADGDTDILATVRHRQQHDRDRIVWYENVNGLGGFGPERIVTSRAEGVLSVFLADLDGDADMDIVWAGLDAPRSGPDIGHVAWHENIDGMGNFGPRRVITDDAILGSSVSAADFDRDGDLDVVSSGPYSVYGGGGLAWYENTDGRGTFENEHVLMRDEEFRVSDVYAADLDGDGDSDLVTVDSYWNIIRVHENVGGNRVFGTPQVLRIDDNDFTTTSIRIVDIDRDGDLDILSRFGGRDWAGTISWFENLDGTGKVWHEQFVSTLPAVQAVVAADLDGDGYEDIAAAANSYDERPTRLIWYRNDASREVPRFHTRSQVDTEWATAVDAADFDGDGDDDVVVGSWNGFVSWHKNTDGLGSFSRMQRMETPRRDKIFSVIGSDIDGDGDQDILAGNWWFENQDGNGTFGAARIVDEGAPTVYSADSADVDGDGDLDVVAGFFYLDRVEVKWYENTDGMGTFGQPQNVARESAGTVKIDTGDIDGDGDEDVIASGAFGVRWYENRDANGNRWVTRGITNVVPRSHRSSVHLADLDQDGDVDVVSSSRNDRSMLTMFWYENVDGQGRFNQQHPFDQGFAPASIDTADVDGDGDLDVIAASFGRRIVWYENTDSRSGFGPPRMIAMGANVFTTGDVNGDGDIDIIAAVVYRSVWWFENVIPPLRLRQPGDANEDLEFDQRDIDQLLQAGKYSTGQSATWSEGDFNGDGFFDRLDVILALQTGNYLQGPYAARTVTVRNDSNDVGGASIEPLDALFSKLGR